MEASPPNESAVPAQAGGAKPAVNPLVGNPALAVPAAPAQPEQTSADDPIWVEKARQVIKRSAGDPYVRHDALSKLKLQYLKQRYGKTIGEDAQK